MEAAISSVEYLSAVKLPFTHDTMVEVLERMEIYFSYVNEFLSGTDEKQDEIVNFIIKYKLFEKLKLFFMKVLDSYPSLFTAEVGDEIQFYFMKVIGARYFLAEAIGNNIGQLIPSYVAILCCATLDPIINATDKCKQAQEMCCSDGLVQFIVAKIFPLLSNIIWEKGSVRKEMLERSLDIVYNCCKLPTNHKYYEDANVVDALVKIREETSQQQNEPDITALLTLGYLIDDSNNDKILSGQGTIHLILEYVTESLAEDEHIIFGFHLEELVTGLSHLAVEDENKDKICDAGGVGVLADVLKQANSDKELISCCNALWLLCFCEKGAMAIGNNADLRTYLDQLRKSKDSTLRVYVNGVFWQLFNTINLKQSNDVVRLTSYSKRVSNDVVSKEVEQHAGADVASKGNKHVMLSYQWDNQTLVKRIADNLKQRGYKVWMDVYEMKEFILDDMAAAVEEADIIVVCVSRQYKNSPNTRRECDYAFQLNKDVIPLMMEKGYRADGWLGMLLGSKLWISFENEDLFEVKLNDLCKRLGNKCKFTEPSIVPVRDVDLHSENPSNSNDPYYGQHHPISTHVAQESDHTDEGRPWKSPERDSEKERDVLRWDNKQTVAWINKNGITDCIKKSVLKKIDGHHLVMLYRLDKTNSKVYYTTMPQIAAHDMLDFLKFTFFLESLFKKSTTN